VTNPVEFMQQVRSEASKVTWPSRNETVVTTIFVLLMVIAAAIFFFLADQAIGAALKFVLSLIR
jgi:preprotein translocase subunit SecE